MFHEGVNQTDDKLYVVVTGVAGVEDVPETEHRVYGELLYNLMIIRCKTVTCEP